MKILVIDDNTTIRETLVKVLTKEGNRVEQAHDGDAAMAMLQKPIDLDKLKVS